MHLVAFVFENIGILLAALLGCAMLIAVKSDYGSTSHSLTTETSVLDDFKSRICPLQWDLYCEAKTHRTIYNSLEVPFNVDDPAIIRAYQKRVVDMAKSFVDPATDPTFDRRLQNLNLMAAVLLEKADRDMYNREIIDRANMADAYAAEHKMDNAEADIKRWKKESMAMRKMQNKVDQSLSQFCEGYGWGGPCWGVDR